MLLLLMFRACQKSGTAWPRWLLTTQLWESCCRVSWFCRPIAQVVKSSRSPSDLHWSSLVTAVLLSRLPIDAVQPAASAITFREMNLVPHVPLEPPSLSCLLCFNLPSFPTWYGFSPNRMSAVLISLVSLKWIGAKKPKFHQFSHQGVAH